MHASDIRFTVRGARGAWPVYGTAYQRYGANTTCFTMETPTGLIILDAGSGIRELSETCARWTSSKPIAILFSHFHLDHTLGLATFSPIYDPSKQIQLWGASPDPSHEWRGALQRLIGEPYWPIDLDDMPAQVTFRDLDLEEPRMELFGLELSWIPVAHTQQCLAFQFRLPGGTITVSTDHEPQCDTSLEAYLDFARGSDVLIQDAQYTPEEYEMRKGWGHGTWRDATAIAKQADIHRLVLTHHDPEHTDEQLDVMVADAQKEFPNTRGATEGMSFGFNTANSAPETVVSDR